MHEVEDGLDVLFPRELFWDYGQFPNQIRRICLDCDDIDIATNRLTALTTLTEVVIYCDGGAKIGP